ncbi:uncharacterized protein PHACADRAFT_185006 [Phanerochaete carnosa HHB-10118-sp]|uniref:Uncharacterized protein n=1 Tax=Phanerochaete carnosa (strain HHB-10118-sp) TaxID=650164 RepID=K5UVG7_PHACS|nr:uncharacterized protein PHACADRAFT_185006 [Phanerochaete carnosa HHB-10118-sp]EKM54011.1 hypothetical protein PHACADRAFT_185006 [Phanerochaete carnosa HHB-10118-sp]
MAKGKRITENAGVQRNRIESHVKPKFVNSFLLYKSYVGLHWTGPHQDEPLRGGGVTIGKVAGELWKDMPRNRKAFWRAMAQQGFAVVSIEKTRRAMKAFIEQYRSKDGYESDADGYDWNATEFMEQNIYDAIVEASDSNEQDFREVKGKRPISDKDKRGLLDTLFYLALQSNHSKDLASSWSGLDKDTKGIWLAKGVEYFDYCGNEKDRRHMMYTAALAELFAQGDHAPIQSAEDFFSTTEIARKPAMKPARDMPENPVSQRSTLFQQHGPTPRAPAIQQPAIISGVPRSLSLGMRAQCMSAMLPSVSSHYRDTNQHASPPSNASMAIGGALVGHAGRNQHADSLPSVVTGPQSLYNAGLTGYDYIRASQRYGAQPLVPQHSLNQYSVIDPRIAFGDKQSVPNWADGGFTHAEQESLTSGWGQPNVAVENIWDLTGVPPGQGPGYLWNDAEWEALLNTVNPYLSHNDAQ